ncbi:hypothetical protein CH300_19970 [Rhodococcus sp. 15-1154-1]|nr:hypothetical protein CH300_19970 [Rhodococcus sp. 15-1154-1]
MGITEGIEHLDFEPGCAARKWVSTRDETPDGVGTCERSADFLITTHLCLFVGKREPRMEPVFVCGPHLEHARAFMESSLRIVGRARCGYCGAVFSTFSDVVSRIVPL